MLSRFYDLVSALLKEDGIEGSIEPGERAAKLSIGGLPLFIGLIEVSRGIVVQCPVGPVRHKDRIGQISRELFKLNADSAWNHGCTFGMNGDDMIVVSRFLTITNLTDEEFMKEFVEFQKVMLDVLTGLTEFEDRICEGGSEPESVFLDNMLRV